jgi:D-alanyl-D-alanine carboxypeptidase/D-alanyl-D-alanine-endopeptidase (penicillin-binding protein 4)
MHRVILLLLVTGWSGSALQLRGADARPAAEGPRRPAAAAATTTLQADLERLIRSSGWRNDQWSVMVLSLDRKDTLFSHSPDLALAPASNVKLFTSAAALYYLGPQFRFNTFLLADGPVRDSVLHGDLLIYGTGDPTIASRFGLKDAVWQAFADTLIAVGIREIRGDIVGDASYFRGPGTGEGWQDSYIDASYAAPASALSFAENIATLQIKPGAEAGWRPEVKLLPGGDGIGIVNQATTVARGRTTIRVFRSAYEAPLTVSGQIALRSGGVLRAVPVSDPARFAAAVLRETLQKRGITVTGGIRSVQRAEESAVTGRSVFAPAFEQKEPVRVLAIHNSPPLIDILEVVNKKSHNLLAEQVLRVVGRVATGDGSVEGGVRAIEHMLEEESGPNGLKLQLYDGSGLSALNRVSARTFVHLLAFMQSSAMWESYWFTLPEAGARDGLRRMGRTAAERNLRAKTGTINHVSALSGYVRAANGERLAFSIMSNNVPSTWKAKRIEDAIGVRLAGFTRPGLGDANGVPTAEPVVASSPPATAPQPPPKPSNDAKPVAPASPSPAPAANGSPSIATRNHTVRPGETLDGIARSYGTTVDAILDANPRVVPRRLQAGATIRIPGSGAETENAPRPKSSYVVRKGDTLDAIAKRHGTTVVALQRANPGLNPRRLLPGTTIRLP